MEPRIVLHGIAVSVASMVVAGCAVSAAPSPDPAPANPNSVTHPNSNLTVDATPISTNYGTILARIATADDGHTYTFGHASLTGQLVVAETGKVGSAPTLPTLLRSTPRIVDIYLALSKNGPVPSGLLNPEKGTMRAATTSPPALPAPSHGSGVHPLTLTADQTWFQNNVCVGNNPSGHDIQIHYCDLQNLGASGINSGPSQYVFNDYGYYNAGLIDQSAPFPGAINAAVWTNNGWQNVWNSSIGPGDWQFEYWGNSGDTYNASEVLGDDYGGPAGLAMGTCCN